MAHGSHGLHVIQSHVVSRGLGSVACARSRLPPKPFEGIVCVCMGWALMYQYQSE